MHARTRKHYPLPSTCIQHEQLKKDGKCQKYTCVVCFSIYSWQFSPLNYQFIKSCRFCLCLIFFLFLVPTITTAVGPTHWDTKLPSWSRSSVCSIETPVINRPSVHFLHRFSSCAGPHQLWSDVKPYMNPVPIPSAPLGAGRIYVR